MNKYHCFISLIFFVNLGQNLGAMDIKGRRKELEQKLGKLELEKLSPRGPSRGEKSPRKGPILSPRNHVEPKAQIANNHDKAPTYLDLGGDDFDLESFEAEATHPTKKIMRNERYRVLPGEDLINSPPGPILSSPRNEIVAEHEISMPQKILRKFKFPKIKFHKKKKLDATGDTENFYRRRDLYMLKISELDQENDNCDLQKVSISSKFNDIKILSSRNKVYEVVRETTSFKEEYKALKRIFKESLLDGLCFAFNHDLKFLAECSTWYSLYVTTEEAKKNTLNKKELNFSEIEEIVLELSSSENSLALQNDYLEFLEEHILPLVKECPGEVRGFFYEMSLAMREALDRDKSEPGERPAIGPKDLAANNFMLYIVNTLLSEREQYPFVFEDEDLKILENDELKKTLKREQFPEPESEIEEKLINGVVERMGRLKNERILNQKDPLKIRKSALNKLMQKTFMEEVEFQPNNYASFVGQFYLTIGKKDSELNMRLKKFKEDVKAALFDGFEANPTD